MQSTSDKTPRPRLSLVVPVFNGAAFIVDSLRQLDAFLRDRPGGVELIVVDDGSKDGTFVLVEQAGATMRTPMRLLRNPRNLGKGAAVARGVAAARGDHIAFLDADLAYPPEQIAAIEAAIEAGADLAIASRVHRESRYLIRPSFFRYLYTRHLAGRLFNWLVRLVLLPGITDSQAGLKGMTAAAARRLFAAPLPRGFSFDLGLLFRARRLRQRIDEVGVLYRYDSEPTTVRFALDTLAVLRDLVRLRLGALGQMPVRGRVAGLLTPPVLLGIATVAVFTLAMARLVVVDWHVALAAWGLSLVALAMLARRATRARAPFRWFRTPADAVALIAILALGAALRFVHLGDLPPMVHPDAAECGLRGLELLGGNVADPFDFSGWYNTPYLSFLPHAGSFGIFGVTMWGLRLPSALVGTLCIIPMYALARLWFGPRSAWFATALFAVSHAAIHFSRIGLWNVQTLLALLTAFALLAAAWRRGSPLAAYAGGVTAGLALYSYTAGRLIVIVAAAFFITQLFGRRRRRAVRLAAWCALGVGIAALPLALNYLKNPAIFTQDRSAAVWVLAAENAGHVQATLGTTDPAAVLWQQFVRTVQGFAVLGDSSGQYGTTQPLLSPWTAALGLLGLGLALRRARAARYRMLLIWTVLGVVLGSVLIIDPPSYTRLIVLFPVPYLLAAVGLTAIARWLGRYARPAHTAVAALVLVTLSGFFNLSGYAHFIRAMERMPREWDVLQIIESEGQDVDYYLFTGPFLLADSPIFKLFTARTRTISGFTEQDLPERLGRDALFVLQGELRGLGTAITERFPGAEREVVEEGGWRQMVLYRCAKEDGCRSAVN